MKQLLLFILLVFICSRVFSQQLKLGEYPYQQQKSALLELASDKQGLLFPRINDTTLINSLAPLDGTVIYFNPQQKLLLRSNGYWHTLNLQSDLNDRWSFDGNATLTRKKLGSTDNNGLSIITNNLERLKVESNGFVGINTTAAPSQRLEVTGNFRLNGAFMPGNSSGTAGSILVSSGANNAPTWIDPMSYLQTMAWLQGGNSPTANRTLGTITNFALQFITNNTERMRISANGNVGIGVTLPGNLLDIAGNGTSTAGLRLNGLGLATPGSANGKMLSVNANGDIIVTETPLITGWAIQGNAGINAATHFLGTTDDRPLILKSNNATYFELGRRQTLGLVQGYPDYTNADEQVLHLYAPIQFYAPAANFYKPKMFTDDQGNFRLKGSSAGTDYFELGATGTANNGGFEFVIGDDGDEPIVFKSYHHINGYSEMMRLQSGRMAVGSSVFSSTDPEKLLVDAGTTSSINLINAKGNINNYLQFNIQNQSAGGTASADIVATANNGNETVNFVNLGINSSTFSNTSQPILGGVNTAYLYSTSTDFVIGNGSSGRNLRFFTGGFALANERLRIDANGNVGIGNQSPAQRLDVTGNIRFSGALMPNNQAGAAGTVLTSAGAGQPPVWTSPSSSGWAPGGNSLSGIQTLGTVSNHDLPFITNNTEAMRLTTGNRLGINTTNPQETLDVSGNIRISGGNRRLLFSTPGGDPDAIIEHRTFTGTESNELLFYVGNDPANGYGPDRIRMVAEEFRLQTFNSVGNNSLANAQADLLPVTRLLIDPSGNTGINTATPSEKLDVSGNIRLSGAFMPAGNAGTTGFILRSNGNGNAPSWIDPSTLGGGSGWSLGGNSLSSASNFGTQSWHDLPIITNNTERMRILTNGHVGINMTNPEYRFQVNGDGAMQGSFIINNSNSNTGDLTSGGLRFGNYSGEGIASKRNAGGNQNGLDFYTSYTRRMWIANTGSVTVAHNFLPAYDFGGITLGASNLRFNTVYAANGTIQTSDIRQKKNIEVLNYGLKEVLALRPVRYAWKNDTLNQQHVGLIAQEVNTIIPEVVSGNESTEILGMNYAELVPVLINAIKEQQVQIDALKKQVNDLQQKK